jgi:hypothetical protein
MRQYSTSAATSKSGTATRITPDLRRIVPKPGENGCVNISAAQGEFSAKNAGENRRNRHNSQSNQAFSSPKPEHPLKSNANSFEASLIRHLTPGFKAY